MPYTIPHARYRVTLIKRLLGVGTDYEQHFFTSLGEAKAYAQQILQIRSEVHHTSARDTYSAPGHILARYKREG